MREMPQIVWIETRLNKNKREKIGRAEINTLTINGKVMAVTRTVGWVI